MAGPLSTPSVYARLARTRGVPRLATAGLATGLAATSIPVALLLFAREATGSLATASLVLAMFTIGGLLTAPLRGRLVDRLGARRALLALAVPSAVTDVALIISGSARAASVVIVLAGLLAGATVPPVGAALRAAWSALLGDETRQAGFALLIALGELSFFGGPLVAGALLAFGSPTLAVTGAAGLSVGGTLLFAGTARPGDNGTAVEAPARRAPTGTGLRAVIATAGLFGVTFGTLDVAFVASAQAEGSSALAGVLLSALAVGVGLGSLAYGARPSSSSAVARYPALCALACVGLAPLLLTLPLGFAVFLAALAGLGFAPITVTQAAAVDELTATGRKAEAFSWLGTAYGAGAAAGAAAAGQLADTHHLRATFGLALVATALAAGLAAAQVRTRPQSNPARLTDR